MDYLSIVACFKNEAPYLREWLEFHRLVGVERFYLYNNASADASGNVLAPYIDAGVARVFSTDMETCQLACYFNALQAFPRQSRWMAFIDVDEYLFCPDGKDLRVFLQEFELYPALGANWVIFGSSGHKIKPPGLTIESYTRCAEPSFERHAHIKSIVNPQQMYCPRTAHSFFPSERCQPAVDENYVPLKGDFRSSPPWTVNRIRVNHYFTRSWEEWCFNKRPRGRADMPVDDLRHDYSHERWRENNRNEVEDTTVLRYLPELKRRLLVP